MVPLLAAGLQAGAQIGNMAFTAGQNKKNQRWQEKMFNWQRDSALTDWRLQADYNSPKAQMQRLKEAGLNPNLVYGNGANAQMSAPVRGASAGSYKGDAPQFDSGSVLGAYLNTRIQNQQIDNLQKQATVADASARLKDAQTASTLMSTNMSAFNLKQKNELAPYVLQAAIKNLEKLGADIEQTKANTMYTIANNLRAEGINEITIRKMENEIKNIVQSNRLSKAQEQEVYQRINNMGIEARLKEFELQQRKAGINPNDPAYQKKIGELLEGMLPQGFMEKFKQGFERNNKAASEYLKNLFKKGRY